MKMADIKVGGDYKARSRGGRVVVVEKNYKPRGHCKAGVKVHTHGRTHEFYMVTNAISEPWAEHAARRKVAEDRWADQRAESDRMKMLAPELTSVVRDHCGDGGWTVYAYEKVQIRFTSAEAVRALIVALGGRGE
jgi:hypothetical protein